MNHAAQEFEFLGCIVSVPADVVFRGRCIQGEKTFHAARLREDVSRVAKLRGFHDDGFLNFEYVFLPKQIDPAGPGARVGDRRTDRNPDAS